MLTVRAVLTAMVALWPASRVKNWALDSLGHHIHSSARISPCLILPGTLLILHARARVGALTAFRGVSVEVGEGAEIGQLNWISAASFLVRESSSPTAGWLILKRESSLTNRHYLDASGGITLGEFATVAGVRTTFITHGIDVRHNVLRTAPISVGSYSMVGGNCAFVLGANVPDRSIVGMGAVVVSGLSEEGFLYVGNPARPRKAVDIGRYGSRGRGPVPATIPGADP